MASSPRQKLACACGDNLRPSLDSSYRARFLEMYSEKLTRSALGPDMPIAEWEDSSVILSRLVW